MSIDQQTELDRSTGSGTFLERLANKVGINSKVSTVFGDPIERDGITVIPVAKVSWGFGGGSGTGGSADKSQVGEGSGGGGGTMVSPRWLHRTKRGQSNLLPHLRFWDDLAPGRWSRHCNNACPAQHSETCPRLTSALHKAAPIHYTM